jgi:putative intracellular protease/amidase
MRRKKIILLIAHRGYQPIEYGLTKKILSQESSFEVLTASNKPGNAEAIDSSTTLVDLTIDQIDPNGIDALFLIGGAGALAALDSKSVYTILQQMLALKKPFGAICIAPRILAKAGVLGGKKATGWDGDHLLNDIFHEHAVTYSHDPVTVDGSIVTASGPEVADKFAWQIIQVLLRTEQS